MRIVAIIVTLVCCGLMFYVKREWKAAMLIMGAMTLTLVDIPGIPLHKANLLLQVAFLLSEWRYLPRHFKRLQSTPYLWIPLLIVSFSALAIAYAFWAVKNEKSLKPILQVSLYCLIVLTFFGLLNYIDKNAIFVNAVTEGRTTRYGDVALGDVYTESDRFRVQAMFNYAFDYGYMCAAILILHLHGWYRHLESKRNFVIALVCCSFGILMCGCRIVWVGTLFSIFCYSMWVFQMNRNVMYGMIAMILMIMSYATIPAVEDKVNKVTDIFVENGETSGSSIQLRMSQYMTVAIHIEGHEWLGQGKGYWEHIYAKDRESIRGLYGVESVILQTLLERGIIGLILWATFYSIIFFYFWRNRTKRKAITGLGASTLTLYLVYSIGTGELGSVYPTMLLLGISMKMIESKKRRLMLKTVLRRIMKRKKLTRRQQLIVILKAMSR